MSSARKLAEAFVSHRRLNGQYHAQISRWLLNKITRIPGIPGVHTSFVLRKVVDRSALPLGG